MIIKSGFYVQALVLVLFASLSSSHGLVSAPSYPKAISVSILLSSCCNFFYHRISVCLLRIRRKVQEEDWGGDWSGFFFVVARIKEKRLLNQNYFDLNIFNSSFKQ